MIKNLNERQNLLYIYLINNCECEKSLEDIYYGMIYKYPNLYPPVTKAKVFGNSNARKMISDDLTIIDEKVKKVIIRMPNKVKIATSKEEALAYLKYKKDRTRKEEKEIRLLEKKIRNHNQISSLGDKSKTIKSYVEVNV